MSDIKNIILNSSEETIEKALAPFIEEQFPSFVRSDYRKLVLFIKAYYEWMDSVGKPSYVLSNLQSVSDIDSNTDEFYEHFKNTYLDGFPDGLATDTTGNKPNKNTLLKKIREFYGNKGTDSAYKFLFRVLYDSDLELYEPKKDVLTVSDGDWIEPRTIKTTSVNGDVLFQYKNGEIRQYNGTQLVAQAFIDDIVQYRSFGYEITEVFVKNIIGDFLPNRPVVYEKDGTTSEETTYSVLGQFYIELPGSDYRVGDRAIVVDQTGVGFSAKIEQLDLAGGVKKISIINSGINYYENVVLDLYNSNGQKNSKIIAISSALTEYPGYFAGNRGKISSNKRIQDGQYYQSYSYVLKTRVSINDYYEILRKVIHPAGTKVIGSILVNGEIENALTASTQATISEVPLVGKYTPYTLRTFNDLRGGYFLPNQVRGATLAVWLSGYNINGVTNTGLPSEDAFDDRNVSWGVWDWVDLARGITFQPVRYPQTDVDFLLSPGFVRSAANTHPSVDIRSNAATNPRIPSGSSVQTRSSGFWSGVSMSTLGLTADRSYFVVFKPRSIGVIGNIGSLGVGTGQVLIGDSQAYHGIVIGRTGTNDNALKAVSFNWNSGTNTPHIVGSIGVTGEWKLLCNTYRRTGSNGPLSMFLNGVCLGTDPQALPPSSGIQTFLSGNGVTLGVGCPDAALVHQFDGEIAEVVLYQGDVGVVDRQKIEGYLAHKYGLASKLPSNHPFKTTPPGASFSDGKWYGSTADFYPTGYNPYMNSASELGPDGTSAAHGSLFVRKYSGYTYTVVSELGKTAHNPAGAPLGGITAWRRKKDKNPNPAVIPGMVLWLKPENIGVCGAVASGASVDVWRDASPSQNHALPPTWDKWNGVADITKTLMSSVYWNRSVYSTNPVTKISFVANGVCGGFTTGRLFMMGMSEVPTSNSGYGAGIFAYSIGPYQLGSGPGGNPRRYILSAANSLNVPYPQTNTELVRASVLPGTANQYDHTSLDKTVIEMEYAEPHVIVRVDGIEKQRIVVGYNKTYYIDSTFYANSQDLVNPESVNTSVTILETSYNGNAVVPALVSSHASTFNISVYAGVTIDKLRPVLQYATSAGATGVLFNGGVLFSPNSTWTSAQGDGYTLGGLIGFGNTFGNGVTAARIMTGQHLHLTKPINLTGETDVFMVFRSTSDSYARGLGLFCSDSNIGNMKYFNDHVLFNRSYNETDRTTNAQTGSYYIVTPTGTFLYPTQAGLVGFRPAGNKAGQQQNSIAYDPHVSGVCMGTVIGEWVRDGKNKINTYLNADPSTNRSEVIGRNICRVNAPSNEAFIINGGLENEFDPTSANALTAIRADNSNLLTPYMSWKHTHINWIRTHHKDATGIVDENPNLIWYGIRSILNGTPGNPTVLEITNLIDPDNLGYPLSALYRFRGTRTWEITPVDETPNGGNAGEIMLYGGPTVGPSYLAGLATAANINANQLSPWNSSTSFTAAAWSFSMRIKRADNTPIPQNSVTMYIDAHGKTSGIAPNFVLEDPNTGWYRVSATRFAPEGTANPNWRSTVTRVGIGGLVPDEKYLVSFPELTTGVISPVVYGSSSQHSGLANGWTDQSSFPTGWTLNGSMEENSIRYITNPWARTSVVWVAENRSGAARYWYDVEGNTLGYTDSDGDGGFNSPVVPIDRNKTYRFSVWVRSATDTLPPPGLGVGDAFENTRGAFYFGLYARDVAGNLTEVESKGGVSVWGPVNPYFASTRNPDQTGNGQWSLFVGHVHPYGGDTGPNHENSGRYTISTQGVSASPAPTMYDYMWTENAVGAQIRAYLYYSTAPGEKYEFYSPRIDCVDGNEPTIEDLVNDQISFINGGGARGTDMHAHDSTRVSSSNGGTLLFDGNGVAINHSPWTTVPVSCTWDVWVNCEQSITSYNMFMGKLLPYFGFRASADPTKFYFFYSTALTPKVGSNTQHALATLSEFSLNKWYNLVVTQNYDDAGDYTTIKMYVNGELKASTTKQGQQTHYPYALTLGDGQPNNISPFANQMKTPWYPFKGKVGPAKLYSRVLNEDEIEQNFNSRRGRFGV